MQVATSATLIRNQNMIANSFDTPKTPRKFKWIWCVMIQSSLVLVTASTNAYDTTNLNIEK